MPVTHDEVRKLIPHLNNQKALGPISIPVTILKDNKNNILVRPLTLILNQSFEQGIFPEILKIAQVLPNHKKEDTVTVLLATTALYLYYLYLAKSLKKLCTIEFILFSVNIN